MLYGKWQPDKTILVIDIPAGIIPVFICYNFHMIRTILNSNDPKLRRKSKPVKQIDKRIAKLIQDMKETLEAQKNPEGVGLAAVQIGKNVQIFIMKLDPKDALKMKEDELIKVIINPEILSIRKVQKEEKEKKGKILEGCLSLPHYYGPLARSKQVKIRYLNEKGEKKVQTFTDFPAQVVLHEIDHLNGVLFVDRLLEQGKPLYEYVENEWREVDF